MKLPSRSYRPKQAAELLGIGIATLWRWIKERSDFPRPIRLSARCYDAALPDDLEDIGFVSAQMFTWAARSLNLGQEHHGALHPEEFRRVTNALKNGVARVEIRIDPAGAVARYILHPDDGESFEMFASVPLPTPGADRV